jgi:glycine cleavage system H protein
LNRDPYGEGWILRLKPADPAESGALMDAAAYEKATA